MLSKKQKNQIEDILKHYIKEGVSLKKVMAIIELEVE